MFEIGDNQNIESVVAKIEGGNSIFEQTDDAQQLEVSLFPELCKVSDSSKIDYHKVGAYARDIAEANGLSIFASKIAELTAKLNCENYLADLDSINHERGLSKLINKYFGNFEKFSENSLKYVSNARNGNFVQQISRAAFLVYAAIEINGNDPEKAFNDVMSTSNSQIKAVLGKYIYKKQINEQREFDSYTAQQMSSASIGNCKYLN